MANVWAMSSWPAWPEISLKLKQKFGMPSTGLVLNFLYFKSYLYRYLSRCTAFPTVVRGSSDVQAARFGRAWAFGDPQSASPGSAEYHPDLRDGAG